jgi:protein-S-isoprenylcysteine O-methyltransferase Ste14
MKTNKIMPPTWMLIAMIAMLALHFLMPLVWIISPFWNLTGLVFMGLGLIVSFVADNAFHRARTTVKPFEESAVLVTGGAYRISRNPMYLGMILILIGVAVLLRSLSPFLVILPFAILLERNYIRVEESMLAEKFGAEWEAYKITVDRWL